MPSPSSATTPDQRLPTFYLPHGGGPCFFMEWPRGPAGTWDRMAAFLRGLIGTLAQRPRAVVVVSGHWEEPG
ncbi:MAG: dioxygenase, partial [Burkholderiaceae bacterium]|nr:dioxygenase [Burkholderiaceae bacterium]